MNHLAIIMDGNRRWATERKLPKFIGHTEGAKNLKTIARAVSQRGISYLTVWALSTENLKNRSEKELKHLYDLFEKIPDYLHDFIKENGRMHIIGNMQKLPKKTQDAFLHVVEKTKTHTGMVLTLAINYGGRDEITRAIQHIVTDGISPELIDEALIETYLDTHNLPKPDMIIRTGGHQRLSGYLPWQSTYSELYFTPAFWPSFNEAELDTALTWFEKQQQNQGK